MQLPKNLDSLFDDLKKIPSKELEESFKEKRGLTDQEKDYKDQIKEKEDWGEYFLRNAVRWICIAAFSIFLIFGITLLGRYVCQIWNEKQSIEYALSGIYNHFLGAIIAIYFDRLLRK